MSTIRVLNPAPKSRPLFGPPRAWKQDEFVASDDRVRGGSSQSYLTPSSTLGTVRFHGVLDTTTLGGAGFASQRTSSDTTRWDLSPFSGVEIHLLRGDCKKYTLNIKTVLPAKMKDGRDASTLEYAYSFTAPEDATRLFARWNQFEPTYRGRPVSDAEPLDPARIVRWSLMMRSFFEQQNGPFSLTIATVKARMDPCPVVADEHEDTDSDWDRCEVDEKNNSFAECDAVEQTGSRPMRFCAIL